MNALKKYFLQNWFLFISVIVISAIYFSGISAVPFHPDESTQLYMSSDVEIFLSHPSSLYWKADQENDLRQRYHELDAPLTRYLAGIGRLITRQPALLNDWDWSKSWDENQAEGALPTDEQLMVGRLSIAIFFPFSLFLLYEITKSLVGRSAGAIAVLLFSANALILLHTRRVMAESVLTFTILLSLYVMLRFPQHPWLIGLPAALAFNAKQSAGALVLAGIFAILYPTVKKKLDFKKIMIHLTGFFAVFLIITFLLNPFLWSNPVQAGKAAWNARQTLLNEQIAVIGAVSPDKILNSFPDRIMGIIIHLFITDPATADVANYLEQTQTADAAYLANPLHSLSRGIIGGSIYMIMALFGFLLSFSKAIKSDLLQNRGFILLCFATTVQFLSLAALVTLPFQRYSIPMVPYVCIWTAMGISIFIEI